MPRKFGYLLAHNRPITINHQDSLRSLNTAAPKCNDVIKYDNLFTIFSKSSVVIRFIKALFELSVTVILVFLSSNHGEQSPNTGLL